jgi:hypothetical protein
MMLEATSLAVQPDLRAAQRTRFPFHYLYGERDEKFAAIARELNAVCHVIPTPDTTPTGKTPPRLPRVWLRYCVFE